MVAVMNYTCIMHLLDGVVAAVAAVIALDTFPFDDVTVVTTSTILAEIIGVVTVLLIVVIKLPLGKVMSVSIVAIVDVVVISSFDVVVIIFSLDIAVVISSLILGVIVAVVAIVFILTADGAIVVVMISPTITTPASPLPIELTATTENVQ